MTRLQKLFILLIFTAASILTIHTFFAADGWPRRSTARRDLKSLDEDSETVREQIQVLRQQINGLRERNDVQEHVVRDELGYGNVNDIIVNIKDVDKVRSKP
ncbi:MAG: septum formation initiator family protein [Deltaproteobacteria bacterium]|nr:septum formation initiator family protein [Deltaproteobacteria bacterium]